ncbi:uncharacterized protein LOC143357476 [Halictus rubicundus]|uniref:uncharacterized protein LOC143357476 n=1 Tax=Halictus rubicundus TaxID=77578 RepID=UPI0040373C6F
MPNFLSTKVVGCIGKCTSGLSPEELDRITDNIHKTLSHPRGIKIFERYLEKCELTDSINCLNLYKTCCDFIKAAESCSESRREPSLEVLIGHVTIAREMAEYLDGVTQIDMDLMQSYNKALNSGSKTDLLAVLQDTRFRCQEYLENIHGSFKEYAAQPCPLTK